MSLSLSLPALPQQIPSAVPAWSPALVVALDWRLLLELVREVLTHHGYELIGTRTLMDAAVVQAMVEHPGTAQARRVLIQSASWNEWAGSSEALSRFCQELNAVAGARGLYIAPAGFTDSARLLAQEKSLELVDAQQLSAALQSLPPPVSQRLLAKAFHPQARTPSCPLCLEKMQRVPKHHSSLEEDLSLSSSGLVAEPMLARCLHVAEGAEITFLQPVFAKEMRISGCVTGDFTCDGPLRLLPGGELHGQVAARSMDVAEGASLHGSFRPLAGNLQPPTSEDQPWHWLCSQRAQRPPCQPLCFQPHPAA
jgi:Polymer-forming cytoskeletal/Restriction endonuclease